MRKQFTETLMELARQDSRLILLTADLGFGFLERFATEFPDRFFNVGIAEQNMVGLATGLAKEGFIPFVYSMGTFSVLRPYEIIRNGPILHQLKVRIVGIGGGFDYGTAGSTHHSLEDIAVLRAQPGINVVSPADSSQTNNAIKSTWLLDGPIYYRLGKDDLADIPGLNGKFDLHQAQRIGTGTDLCFISTGRITETVVKAVNNLRENHGIDASVFVVSSFNLELANNLRESIGSFSKIISVEAHFTNGGLGSFIAEVIAENSVDCRLLRIGVIRHQTSHSGDAPYLNAAHGLDAQKISESALAFYRKS
jgi:transketolase